MKNVITILILAISFVSFGQTFTSKDSAMIAEINVLRANPASYIPKVEKYIKVCEMKQAKANNGNLVTTTDYSKHIEAAKELIAELESISSLPLLIPNVDMFTVTEAHAEYLSSIGKVSHTDANGNTATERMSGVNVKNVTENIVTDNGIITSAILVLLVDGDIDGRGHRKNLLDPNAKFISVHTTGDYWVMNFAN